MRTSRVCAPASLLAAAVLCFAACGVKGEPTHPSGVWGMTPVAAPATPATGKSASEDAPQQTP